NPAGARALAASLRAYFPGRPVTFVIGILADKDAGGILAALVPLAARIVLTASGNPRAVAPETLPALLPARAAGVPGDVVPAPASAPRARACRWPWCGDPPRRWRAPPTWRGRGSSAWPARSRSSATCLPQP